MKDHEKANFINELTEIARAFSATQQLRERISYCVHKHMPKENYTSVPTCGCTNGNHRRCIR